MGAESSIEPGLSWSGSRLSPVPSAPFSYRCRVCSLASVGGRYDSGAKREARIVSLRATHPRTDGSHAANSGLQLPPLDRGTG